MTSPTNRMTTADAKDRARAKTLRAMQLHDGGDNYRLFNAGWDAALEAPHSRTEAITDEMIEAVMAVVEEKLCIVWARPGSREEFVALLEATMQAARPIEREMTDYVNHIRVNWKHIDGPLMTLPDGRLKWLTLRERFMHWIGAWSLGDIAIRPDGFSKLVYYAPHDIWLDKRAADAETPEPGPIAPVQDDYCGIVVTNDDPVQDDER